MELIHATIGKEEDLQLNIRNEKPPIDSHDRMLVAIAAAQVIYLVLVVFLYSLLCVVYAVHTSTTTFFSVLGIHSKHTGYPLHKTGRQ